MNLYLVQHGLAVDKSIDPDRPLSEQGVKDIQRMADFLKASRVCPSRILHSGKTRARQTAKIIAVTLSGIKPGVLENINPNDPLDSACGVINQLDCDAMIVGHLPFMQRLVSFLLNQNENTGFFFLPGSVVCLSKAEDRWRMDWMVRPDIITN